MPTTTTSRLPGGPPSVRGPLGVSASVDPVRSTVMALVVSLLMPMVPYTTGREPMAVDNWIAGDPAFVSRRGGAGTSARTCSRIDRPRVLAPPSGPLGEELVGRVEDGEAAVVLPGGAVDAHPGADFDAGDLGSAEEDDGHGA